MISFLETRSIFERRYCIQLRTSSSSSTYVSFCPPPSSLDLFPGSFLFFSRPLDALTNSFSTDFEFLCCTVDIIFLSVFNSGLFKPHTIFMASSSFVGYCLIFANVIHHSTNSNLMFATMKLKFCFCFEKSIQIRTAFYKVDSKQTHRSKNIM